MSEKVNKIVLAYSGGLDTSVILAWLKDTYECPVVAYAADLGQGDEVDEIREKAINTGAEEVIIEDLREEFTRDYVWPALRANAVYESGYLLGTSLARPLIALRQVEAARKTGSDAVSHGATGKGNDQVGLKWHIWPLNRASRLLHPGEPGTLKAGKILWHMQRKRTYRSL